MEFAARRPALRRLRRSGRAARQPDLPVARARSGSRRGRESTPGSAARAFFAAGVRAGDIVHNAFLLPHDAGRLHPRRGRAGAGLPGLPGRHRQAPTAQVEAAHALQAERLLRHARFPQVILDRAAETGTDLLARFRIGAGVGRRAVSRRCAPEYAAARHHACCSAMRPPSSASSPMRAPPRTARPIPA